MLDNGRLVLFINIVPLPKEKQNNICGSNEEWQTRSLLQFLFFVH